MLSIGIRCGRGFDKNTLASLIETGKRPYEYDVLILGTNPGGLACAEEAVRSGKKIALVSWRIPTSGEEESHDEDKYQMLEALQMDEQSIRERTYALLDQEGKTELMPAIKFSRFKSSKASQVELRNDQRHSKWCRKIRRSRIDLRNAFTDMALEGIRYMHEMAEMRDLVLSKNSSAKSQAVSWGKMMENLLDHVIEKRWHVLTDFLQSKINIYCGHPISIGNHSVRITTNNCEEKMITAETIITALEVRYSFPSDVAGSREFGINTGDFYRLFLSPGKTLIVGGNQLGLSCAGILASFGFPVALVYRGNVYKGGDSEIIGLIVKNLQSKGVKFMEKQSLTSIQKNKTGDALVAEFIPVGLNASNIKKKYSVEFDTVLFTTVENLNPRKSGKSGFETEYESLAGKLCSIEERQAMQSYIDIPINPGNKAATELVGKHIGQQLFGIEERQPNFNLIPTNVLTPIEYSYLGASEHIAITRLGGECVEIYKGYFQTEDVISDASSSKSEICFAKIISVRERDLVVGLHLFGRNAIRIMDKILEPITGKITISNLHPAIRNLLKADGSVTTSDAGREKIFHPFRCRLPQDSAFPQGDPASLVGTGFTSMALGIITAFRPTPFLLIILMYSVRSNKRDLFFFHVCGPYLVYSWLALIFLTLFAGGLTMACSRKIKKRRVLAIHPWALLVLYLDPIFWLSVTLYLHVISAIEDQDMFFENLKYPIIYFSFVYLDIVLFIMLHYLFATYFIIAQLTVIEKFF